MRNIAAAVMSLLLACGGGRLPGLSSEDLYGIGAEGITLFGVVRDVENGAPIASATVQLQGQAVQTGADGAYRIEEGLQGGLAEGSVTAAGYEAKTLRFELFQGDNRWDFALGHLRCEQTGCGTSEYCDAQSGRCRPAGGVATLSGGVIDLCSGMAIAARVSAGGASTCSGDLKPYFQLVNLPAGGPQAVAAGKSGYKPYLDQITLQPGVGNTLSIQLEPEGGCTAMAPAPSSCSCTEPRCQ